MAKYSGIIAGALTTHLTLSSISNVHSYAINQDDDSVYAIREAIKQAFLDQLSSDVTIEVQSNETLRFHYGDFELSIPFVDEGVVNVGGSGAQWVDIFDNRGQYLSRKDLAGAKANAAMVRRGHDVISGKVKPRKF